MKRIGEDPSLGCGRATWENSGENGNYGTTMALMLLPFWTDGCIGSMEGLVLRGVGHDAVPLPHDGGDVEAVVEPGARAALRRQQRRGRCAPPAGPRRQVRDGAHDRGQGGGGRASPSCRSSPRRTRGTSTRCRAPTSSCRSTCSRSSSTTARATSASATSSSARAGSRIPTSGRRCRPTTAPTTGSGSTSTSTRTAASSTTRARRPASTSSCRPQPIEPVALPPRRGLERRDQRAVVVVRRRPHRRAGARQGQLLPELGGATGADGPYRIGPNMMVVVPTSNHVELNYGRSAIDYLTMLLTLLGIGAVLRVAPAGRRRARRPRAGRVVVVAATCPARWSLAGAHLDTTIMTTSTTRRPRRRPRRRSRRRPTTSTTTTGRPLSDAGVPIRPTWIRSNDRSEPGDTCRVASTAAYVSTG